MSRTIKQYLPRISSNISKVKVLVQEFSTFIENLFYYSILVLVSFLCSNLRRGS